MTDTLRDELTQADAIHEMVAALAAAREALDGLRDAGVRGTAVDEAETAYSAAIHAVAVAIEEGQG